MAEAEIPHCPGPDPDPRPPRTMPPPGACDCHAHLFGPVSKYPYSPARGYTPPDASLTDYEKLHAILGIDRAVMTQPSVYGTDNSAILDAIAASEDRMRGVAAVGGDVSDDELHRLHDAGIRGIRVNTADKGGMPFDSMAEFARFAERLKTLGWHAELLNKVAEAPDFFDRFCDFPVDIVVGHLGYMRTSEGLQNQGFQDLLELVRRGKCWVKLTGTYRITERDAPPYDDVPPFAQALAQANPDRIVWGSDWPHPFHYRAMPNDGHLLDQLEDWGFDEALRHRILVENPVNLYGF